ncbi:lytic polysaccharide monooxygenase auxiliary activity family 9 protein [Kitasatospora sp. NPDC004240]
MPVRHRLSAVALVLATTGLTTVLGSGTAAGHGSMQNPLSRVEGCFLEGAENPKSAACKAAVATGGKAALYDWMSLRIGDAAGRHRQLIPDGKLCSAGDPVYTGMDLPRADWPATNLTAGADFTFRYRATAPHRGSFQLFITNASYDPTKPLAWSNLESQPFLTVTDPKLVDGSYVLPGKIPANRTGRQLIYAIWQRSDSPEAFYSCSDVVFDGSGTAPTTGGTTGTTTGGTGTGGTTTGGTTTGGATGGGTGGSHPGGHDHPTAAPTATTGAPAPAPATSSAVAPAPATDRTTQAATGTAGTTPTAAGAGAAAPSSTTAEAGNLAQTGSDRSIGIIASVGSAFLLAGAAVAVIHRKRRSPGAHAR